MFPYLHSINLLQNYNSSTNKFSRCYWLLFLVFAPFGQVHANTNTGNSFSIAGVRWNHLNSVIFIFVASNFDICLSLMIKTFVIHCMLVRKLLSLQCQQLGGMWTWICHHQYTDRPMLVVARNTTGVYRVYKWYIFWNKQDLLTIRDKSWTSAKYIVKNPENMCTLANIIIRMALSCLDNICWPIIGKHC